MAQKVQVLITCDLDEEETEAAETVTFGHDGATYELEMCQQHLDEFNNWIGEYIGVARRAGSVNRARRAAAGAGTGSRSRSRSRGAGSTSSLGAIREWARANGFNVSDRGRISGEVRAAFDAAH
ncbi:MAG TPA: Lsr2 family protein [Acidimicrobiales bacterium]|nr:Lsr2 family protein [Acidimicrobiales bacterium]